MNLHLISAFLVTVGVFLERLSAMPVGDQHLASLLFKKVTDGISYSRTVRIYSRSSRWHLRVVGSKIDSLSKTPNDPNSIMVLQSVNILGHIRIKSQKENKYICVSKDGRLVLEKNGTTLQRCRFLEGFHNGFTQFKSVFNDTWHLGIKKSGRVKWPKDTTESQTAALFLIDNYTPPSTR